MGRSVPRRTSIFAIALMLASVALAAQQDPASQSAAAAMKRGDFQAAEKTLRAEVAAHSSNAWALSLLGVALDNQKKLAEAEEFHSQAVSLSPNSAEILNNYGTHQWIVGQLDKAEVTFSRALAAAPAYFNVLFNLGVMATFTHHYERAHEALDAALRQQPQNADVLYCLASVEEATAQLEPALMHLAQAAKLNPRRPDVQKLMAVAATELGALDDAAAAWDRYLKLEPNDQAARRERGLTAARMGKLEQGMADLEWYVGQRPDDPVGHYELAEAQRSTDIAQSLKHLNQALTLKPDYTQARAARGSLYYQEGKPESALPDLEQVESQRPDDAANLDRLGQTYQALDRPADAVRVLRRAAELAPRDSATSLHFARALADAGQSDESKAEMDRFKRLGPAQKKGVPAGLVDYLSLTPGQRRADFRARVEAAVKSHPDDSSAQLEHLKLMIEDRNAAQVANASKRLEALKPASALLAEAGRALLAANYNAPAKDLLQAAVSTSHADDVELPLAVATFRLDGAKPALAFMDRLPPSARGADYYMARAEMVDASGNVDEAISALDLALRAAPEQADLYRQAVMLLVKRGRAPEAMRIAEQGARNLPQNRQVLLLDATTLEFAGRVEESDRLLIEIQNRWPEWPNVWLVHGVILASHRHYDEARQALDTAAALGSKPEAAAELEQLAALRKGAKADPALLNQIFQGKFSQDKPGEP